VPVLLDDAALIARGLMVPEEPPLMPVTPLTTFEEIEQTGWFGRMLVGIMKRAARRTAQSGTSLGEGEVAITVCVDGLLGSSWCSLQLITGGGMPSWVIALQVHLLNGFVNLYLLGVGLLVMALWMR